MLRSPVEQVPGNSWPARRRCTTWAARNVLWELRPSPQTDEAFHRGADVAMLSQFAAEREVLFPPCTMLRVLRRDAGGEAEGAAAGGPDRRHAGLRVNSDCFELQKRFIAIEVQPSFV